MNRLIKLTEISVKDDKIVNQNPVLINVDYLIRVSIRNGWTHISVDDTTIPYIKVKETPEEIFNLINYD